MDRMVARSRLDERLAAAQVPTRPHRGWVRAIRDVLGMSTAELATRMGIAQQRVSAIEKAEADRTVQLDTLDRAAAALGCRVAYVLVPVDGTLHDMVWAQARNRAAHELAAVDTTMRLEDQQVDDDRQQALIDQRASELVDKRGLWATAP